MIRKTGILTLAALFAVLASAYGQKAAVKTNLLYGATATPNLGVEIGLGKRTSLDISGGYNPWNLDGSRNDNRKIVHWLVQPEFRYWTCSRLSGHFFGLHAIAGQFNIGGMELPMLLGKGSKDFRHEGWTAGAGITYGYHWVLAPRWSLEFAVGAGYMRMQYDVYDCPHCGYFKERKKRDYFGPTKAAINLIFIIK